MKRFWALFLTLVLFWGILPISSSAWTVHVVPGIGFLGINASDTNHQYSAYWQYWSQAASKYEKMRKWGCRVVAHAKLLVELGAASADVNVFNPDLYLDWGLSQGYWPYEGDFYEQPAPGVAAVQYAANQGINLTRSYVGLSGKNSADDVQTVMNYINAGYYVILHHNDHQAYVGRAASLANGTPVIFDSTNEASYADYNCLTYSGYGRVYYTGMYVFGTDSSTPITASVNWNNHTQTAYETNFYAFATAQANIYGTFQEAGITVWNSDGTVVAQKSENPNHGNSTLDVWYNITDEIGAVLSSGQSYTYQFRVRFNGTDFYSPTYSITTTCSHSNIVIDGAVAPSCTESGLTEGSHCATCGTVLTEQAVVPPTGHNYENNVCKNCGDTTTSWSFDEATGTLTIFGEGPMPDYSASSSDNRPWADLVSRIKHVVISNGITSIGAHAFQGCANLESVSIPDGITSIGNTAFFNCSSLDNVTLPDSLTTFGEGAFMACNSLSEIVIPGKMKTIGERVFASCDKLSKVTLPEGITEIGHWAFFYCSSLTEITLPNTVTKITRSFDNCTGLERVTLSKNLTHLNGGFNKCTSLKEITIPASVTLVGQSTFTKCENLEIYFTGDAPKFEGANPTPFSYTTLTIYYPESNDTWTSKVREQYAGTITWIPYNPSGMGCSHTYGDWTISVPAGCESSGSKTRSCSLCGDTQTEVIPPTGHDWNTTVIPANCQHTKQTRTVCRNCLSEELESEPMEYSVWAESYPETAIEGFVETMTQYRYRDRLNTWGDPVTHTLEYAWPQDTEDWQGVERSSSFYSQYNHIPVTECKNDSEKITVVSTEHIGYLYFHWCQGQTGGPYNRVISNCYETNYPYFHSFTSTEAGSDYDANGSYGETAKYLYNNACCTDSWWWRQIPLYRQTYTVQTKKQATDSWGSWSEWFGESVSASDTRQVESRTLYRYVTNLGEHTYTGDNKTQCSVCTHFRVDEDIPGSSPSFPDYTGDSHVTEADAIYLLWHNLFPGTYPISLSGDVNDDGIENTYDAVYLLWYALELL